MIGIEEFDKVDMRVGTILEVSVNKKSRNQAYILKIDFGENLGIKNPLHKLLLFINLRILLADKSYAA